MQERKTSENLRLDTMEDVADFFLDGQNPGYAHCAAGVKNGLDLVAQAAFLDQEASVQLPLQPSAEGTDPASIDMLVMLTGKVVHAEVLRDTREGDGYEGQVLSHGRYLGQHVMLVETYGVDGEGNKTVALEAMTSSPESLSMPEIPDADPFITTGEKQRSWDALLDDLKEIPDAAVQEEDIVRAWVSRQANRRQQ